MRKLLSALAPWVVVPVGALGLLACNSISGVGDYEFGVGGSATTPSGLGGASGSAGAGASAGGSSAGTPTGTGGAGAAGGSGGAPPSWTVVDTLTVPSDGSDVVSTFVLQNGLGYRLRASGTCVVRSGDEGDAEWWDFSDPQTLDPSQAVDLGIGIDDPIVDATTTPYWGPYEPSHIYEVDFVGKGAPITANFHDPEFDNNSGELTVEVLAPQ